MFALLLVMVVKGLRYATAQRRSTGLARWNPFAFWTRGELVGFLILHTFMLASIVATVRGVASIETAALFPMAAVSGNLGHPDGVAYTADFQGSPGGDFVHALALQKAGELEGAARIYERLDAAEAKNNLGVIRHAQGRTREAQDRFEEAHSTDPGLAEAAYNLGESASSSRLERARKYGLEGPIYAMPTRGAWTEALTGPFELNALLDSVGTMQQFVGIELVIPFALFTLVLTALAILALFYPSRETASQARSKTSFIGWVLGFVVPGTARNLSFLGPPLLTVCTFSAFGRIVLSKSDGVATDILAAVAQPNLMRAFGIAEPIYAPLEEVMRQMASLWWIFWVVNLVAVILLERFSPDSR